MPNGQPVREEEERVEGTKLGDGDATIVGHGEDGDLGDGAVAALDAAGALVDGGQIGVHVAGEAAPAGHLLAGRRHLAQRLGVRRHVRQDHQHVLLALRAPQTLTTTKNMSEIDRRWPIVDDSHFGKW